MAPNRYIFDIDGLDLTRTIYDQEAIREANPQRGHMEHLNGILYADAALGRIVGFKDVRPDEFWVEGHIPGRPLLPGVIMVEAGAQLASFYTRKFVGWKGFIGFGGVEAVKFRMPVAPGCRMILLGQKLWERHRRICSLIQGLVDGVRAFEAEITGTEF